MKYTIFAGYMISTETISLIGITLICWLLFIALDLIVSGIASLAFGMSFRRIFLWGLLSLLLPPVLMAYGALIERNIYQVKEVEISYENLPETFDGYRIVHLSDIHARSFMKRQKSLSRAVEKINRLDADLIAFTGDLMTLVPEEIDMISDELTRLEAKDGTLSVLGNHDYGIYAEKDNGRSSGEILETIIRKEKELGWRLLMDENVIIRRGTDSIAVAGVQNTSPSRHFPSKGNLEKASRGTKGMFRILLTHDPMHWEMEVTGKDYPLTLSGHTHAMQFSIFGWCPSRYIFKHYRGLYKNGDRYLYVNTGLGETIFPVRIGTPPEITLITLKRP